MRIATGYSGACVLLLLIHVATEIDIERIGWRVGGIFLAWYVILPALIWRWNACGGCGARMAPELRALDETPER